MAPALVIIDDSEGFLESAAGLLGDEGFDVVGCVADPAEAVEVVSRLRPSVVLLDVQLPGTDGFALAVELARLDPPPTVVLTSSRPASSYGVDLRRVPVRGFIAKGDLNGADLAAMV